MVVARAPSIRDGAMEVAKAASTEPSKKSHAAVRPFTSAIADPDALDEHEIKDATQRLNNHKDAFTIFFCVLGFIVVGAPAIGKYSGKWHCCIDEKEGKAAGDKVKPRALRDADYAASTTKDVLGCAPAAAGGCASNTTLWYDKEGAALANGTAHTRYDSSGTIAIAFAVMIAVMFVAWLVYYVLVRKKAFKTAASQKSTVSALFVFFALCVSFAEYGAGYVGFWDVELTWLVAFFFGFGKLNIIRSSMTAAACVMLYILFSWPGVASENPKFTSMSRAFKGGVPLVLSIFLVPSLYFVSLSKQSSKKMRHALKEEIRDINKEREFATLLLNQMLPKAITEKITTSGATYASEYQNCTMLFAYICGLKEYSEKVEVAHTFLNNLFCKFDALCSEYEVEKIKTIGADYMVGSGLPVTNKDHAENMADMTLAMVETIKAYNAEHGSHLKWKFGMATGRAVAGVIGQSKFTFDVFGDTVNTASRMYSHCKKGEIQCTEGLKQQLEDMFVLEATNGGKEMLIKGKGMMKTFFLKRRKAGTLRPPERRAAHAREKDKAEPSNGDHDKANGGEAGLAAMPPSPPKSGMGRRSKTSLLKTFKSAGRAYSLRSNLMKSAAASPKGNFPAGGWMRGQGEKVDEDESEAVSVILTKWKKAHDSPYRAGLHYYRARGFCCCCSLAGTEEAKEFIELEENFREQMRTDARGSISIWWGLYLVVIILAYQTMKLMYGQSKAADSIFAYVVLPIVVTFMLFNMDNEHTRPIVRRIGDAAPGSGVIVGVGVAMSLMYLYGFSQNGYLFVTIMYMCNTFTLVPHFDVAVVNVVLLTVFVLCASPQFAEGREKQETFLNLAFEYLVPVTTVSLACHFSGEQHNRKRFKNNQVRVEEKGKLTLLKDKTQELLERTPMPEKYLTILKETGELKTTAFDAYGSILFADIVSFTTFSGSVSATRLVKILNSMFIKFDHESEHYGVEKIKTIGDCYVAATGVLSQTPGENHAVQMIKMAYGMHEAMDELNDEFGITWNPPPPKDYCKGLRIRIGIHSGTVMGGIMGSTKLEFDLWGDTVEMANEFEAEGVPMRINISESTYLRAKENTEGFTFEDRGKIHIPGFGEQQAYLVADPNARAWGNRNRRARSKDSGGKGVAQVESKTKAVRLSKANKRSSIASSRMLEIDKN